MFSLIIHTRCKAVIKTALQEFKLTFSAIYQGLNYITVLACFNIGTKELFCLFIRMDQAQKTRNLALFMSNLNKNKS